MKILLVIFAFLSPFVLKAQSKTDLVKPAKTDVLQAWVPENIRINKLQTNLECDE